jgi:hypothetical protein
MTEKRGGGRDPEEGREEEREICASNVRIHNKTTTGFYGRHHSDAEITRFQLFESWVVGASTYVQGAGVESRETRS